VQPCPYFPVSFGNVRNEALGSISYRMFEDSLFSMVRYARCASTDPLVRNYFSANITGCKMPIKIGVDV
jgi:MoaA/NifB/PqqE/SkfB family radical SAM enzyme